MYLAQLIEALKAEDPNRVAAEGFAYPHSYRGIYSELAFEPAENVTIGSMLEAAESAMGKTFTGYKGGEYTMGEYTDVYLAQYGDTGEELTTRTLHCLLHHAPIPTPAQEGEQP